MMLNCFLIYWVKQVGSTHSFFGEELKGPKRKKGYDPNYHFRF